MDFESWLGRRVLLALKNVGGQSFFRLARPPPFASSSMFLRLHLHCYPKRGSMTQSSKDAVLDELSRFRYVIHGRFGDLLSEAALRE
jgi:hypothetical protein